ncbi:alkaline phosphatase D family protein [Phytoactinopolyspora endophytica]|uniref:alkaline phosphatase D family protein n=1 Tax=Phytoactinopolyspora endophytica TaxID=1642495 RepID=UPI00101C9CCF|nr:alkaline phosphatase D family protein [Phytoactinopolyspora endophytica]
MSRPGLESIINSSRSGERVPRSLSRRSFMALSGTSAAALAFNLPDVASAGTRAGRFQDYPFSLGVASGDPLPDSVVLWTRLAPEPLSSSGGMGDARVPVQWQVAEDENFAQVVRSGIAMAHREVVHSVHVDVKGLSPGREYFYRFKAGREISPVGRTKTAPEPGSTTTTLRFAAAACQAWYDGYYTAYRHLADEDLDFVLHLGDYLYEYSVWTRGGRPDVELPDKYDRVTMTLSDYRDRYALYKLDPDLQAAHAAAPWIVSWDDHEVVNNYMGDTDHRGTPPEEFLVRRANAYRAYWEHQPLRVPAPDGPDMRLYRRFTFGDLIEFNVLDFHQYGDAFACGGGVHVDCEERLDPSRTILGDAQETWLLDGLSRSSARWNVLAQQRMMSQLMRETDAGLAIPMTYWDGYQPARDRIFNAFQDFGVSNPISLSGDLHRSVAGELKEDFDDPDSATIGSEYEISSISSGEDGSDIDRFGENIMRSNAHLKFYNSQRGYVRFTATSDEWRADYRIVPYVREEDAPVSTRASLLTEDGRPGVEIIDENEPQGTLYGLEEDPAD